MSARAETDRTDGRKTAFDDGERWLKSFANGPKSFA